VSRSMRQHAITSDIARQLGGITLNRRRLVKVLQERAEELGLDYR
jgi:flavin-dependent dehydrogenase